MLKSGYKAYVTVLSLFLPFEVVRAAWKHAHELDQTVQWLYAFLNISHLVGLAALLYFPAAIVMSFVLYVPVMFVFAMAFNVASWFKDLPDEKERVWRKSFEDRFLKWLVMPCTALFSLIWAAPLAIGKSWLFARPHFTLYEWMFTIPAAAIIVLAYVSLWGWFKKWWGADKADINS